MIESHVPWLTSRFQEVERVTVKVTVVIPFAFDFVPCDTLTTRTVDAVIVIVAVADVAS